MAADFKAFQSPEVFFQNADRYDIAVSSSPGILDFCSSSYWLKSAHEFLHRDDRQGGSFIAAHDHDASHWIAFAKGSSWFWEPLENAWAFSCPLIGEDPDVALDLLEAVSDQEFEIGAAFLIGGVSENGALNRAIFRRERSYRRIVDFEGMACMTIDLRHGVDAYLARRASKFRKNLRSCQRRVREAGVSIEIAEGTWNELFERILRIQQRTTKWLRGDDIFHHDGYLGFYSALASAANDDKIMRLMIARIDDEDIAFILGIDFRDTYRGLQMSFAASHAHLGIGNVLQFENLKRCVAAGVFGYDLGMFAPYKEKWADKREEFRNLLLIL